MRLPYRPASLEQVKQVTDLFRWHYNEERPHQARSCGNQPPCRAYPELPHLPRLPDRINPDGWLQAVHRQRFRRRVQRNGSVQVGTYRYYIDSALKGRHAILQVNATEHQFVVCLHGQPIKTIPIKGLYGKILDFQDYLKLLFEEAVSEWRRWQWKQSRPPSPQGHDVGEQAEVPMT